MLALDKYAALRPPERLREQPELIPTPRVVPELELQAAWFAGDFGRSFVSTGGEPVEIVQFGVWNREAGPDFIEAAISIDGAPAVRGAIELDPDARDWENHGHATNPDYNDVVLHVFTSRGGAEFFTRTSQHRLIPQVMIDPEARGPVPVTVVPAAKLGRCSGPLRAMEEERVVAILEAAAQFRMRAKAARMARVTAGHGADEALFQALAAALGYKNNQLAFTLLAQRLPLRQLRRAGVPAAALLFGVAGFLHAPDLAVFDPDTRGYLRERWEEWWAWRAEYGRLILPARAWKLGGVRPANHPQRRIAALARLVAHWPTLRRLAVTCEPKAVRQFLSGLEDPYWSRHFTLTSQATAKPMALLGSGRISDILVNVLFPGALAEEPARWSEFRELPASHGNRRVEIAAIRLLQDHPSRAMLLKTAARQQGLLQIYEDFCRRDDSDCARCPFPAQIAQWDRFRD